MTQVVRRQQYYGFLLSLTLPVVSATAAEPIPIPGAMPGEFDGGAHCITTLKQLQRLNARQLEQLFAQAEAAPFPVGYVRGQILILDGPLPRVGAWASGLVWKGKHFDTNGCFINQWLGFRALHSSAAYGPSWYDGRPSLVLEYPPSTPLFANMRDEVREVAPGLFLSRVYRRSPCKFRGYIGLQLEPQNGHKRP